MSNQWNEQAAQAVFQASDGSLLSMAERMGMDVDQFVDSLLKADLILRCQGLEPDEALKRLVGSGSKKAQALLAKARDYSPPEKKPQDEVPENGNQEETGDWAWQKSVRPKDGRGRKASRTGTESVERELEVVAKPKLSPVDELYQEALERLSNRGALIDQADRCGSAKATRAQLEIPENQTGRQAWQKLLRHFSTTEGQLFPHL